MIAVTRERLALSNCRRSQVSRKKPKAVLQNSVIQQYGRPIQNDDVDVVPSQCAREHAAQLCLEPEARASERVRVHVYGDVDIAVWLGFPPCHRSEQIGLEDFGTGPEGCAQTVGDFL